MNQAAIESLTRSLADTLRAWWNCGSRNTTTSLDLARSIGVLIDAKVEEERERRELVRRDARLEELERELRELTRRVAAKENGDAERNRIDQTPA